MNRRYRFLLLAVAVYIFYRSASVTYADHTNSTYADKAIELKCLREKAKYEPYHQGVLFVSELTIESENPAEAYAGSKIVYFHIKTYEIASGKLFSEVTLPYLCTSDGARCGVTVGTGKTLEPVVALNQDFSFNSLSKDDAPYAIIFPGLALNFHTMSVEDRGIKFHTPIKKFQGVADHWILQECEGTSKASE